MGHAGEDCQPGQTRDSQNAQPDEALPRNDIMEPRTPPAPKRPLPPTHIHSLSSLAMPRPNSVAGMFTTSPAIVHIEEPSSFHRKKTKSIFPIRYKNVLKYQSIW